MAGKSYVGDIGTRVELTTGVDLSEATVTKIKVKITRAQNPPFEEFDEWDALVKDPATGGVLEYTIELDDFKEPGQYSLAADVVFDDGSRYTGETAAFTVYEVFE